MLKTNVDLAGIQIIPKSDTSCMIEHYSCVSKNPFQAKNPVNTLLYVSNICSRLEPSSDVGQTQIRGQNTAYQPFPASNQIKHELETHSRLATESNLSQTLIPC